MAQSALGENTYSVHLQKESSTCSTFKQKVRVKQPVQAWFNACTIFYPLLFLSIKEHWNSSSIHFLLHTDTHTSTFLLWPKQSKKFLLLQWNFSITLKWTTKNNTNTLEVWSNYSLKYLSKYISKFVASVIVQPTEPQFS